ncbi:hypothetical protein Bbelb_270870 [Branchiostoma belcheri]|nr:hypothetical protein Bbelb_270870 [Branchiostoma belcheri]
MAKRTFFAKNEKRVYPNFTKLVLGSGRYPEKPFLPDRPSESLAGNGILAVSTQLATPKARHAARREPVREPVGYAARTPSETHGRPLKRTFRTVYKVFEASWTVFGLCQGVQYPRLPPGTGSRPKRSVTPNGYLNGRFSEPARDLTAARPNCKSRSAPYHTPHGSRRATDRAPDGSLTETGRKTAGRSTSRPRQGAVKEHLIVTLTVRRTLGVMTPAGVYTEDMPNGRRFKCDLSINEP